MIIAILLDGRAIMSALKSFRRPQAAAIKVPGRRRADERIQSGNWIVLSYILSFKPDAAHIEDGKLHRIEIKARSAKLKVLQSKVAYMGKSHDR